MNLPEGYRVDEITDPGVVFLRRPDGSVAAIFTRAADPKEIEHEAWRDHAERSGE